MTTSASNPAELANAVRQFCDRIDPDAIDARQPMGPATVYWPWVVVWLLVYQRLHANATLAEAVAELLRSADVLPPNRRIATRTLSTNTGAYSRARTRLRPDIPDAVADRVFDTLVAATPPSFGERRVMLLDGTTITRSPTAELQKAFPPATNGSGTRAGPVWHGVVAHELAGGCALRPEAGPMYGPQALSEQALAIRLLPRLPARPVVLADRNFGTFGFTCAAKSAGHDVVLRLTQTRFHAWVKSAKSVGPGRWTWCWKPSRWDRPTHPDLPKGARVSVPLHEIVVSEPLTRWRVTTLPNSGAELASLYKLRRDVETDIRDVKRTLKREEMRGPSVAMVGKELSAGLVAYNLVVQVRCRAARRARVKPRRLSFAGVWSLVKVVLLSPNGWSLSPWEEKFEWVLRGAGQRKRPERPDRSYPRTLIRRARKFPNRPLPAPPTDTK